MASHGEPEHICFYGVRDAYGYLSNFWPAPIACDGALWPTTEHYFQAQKFTDLAHREAIRRVASPMIAARMGRSRARPLRSDWEAVKDDIMLAALRAKFTQHADLRAHLLATGDALLIEQSARDAYWADGGDGQGLNRLGASLMQVREELRRMMG
jgi:hypothetical protein